MRPQTAVEDSPAVLSCPHAIELPAAQAELVAAREKIENLETALSTARKIGTAVGVVMASYKVKDEAAFDILVMVSQNKHRKLRDIAEDVIITGTLDWGTL